MQEQDPTETSGGDAMTHEKTGVVVIGGGPGGYVAAIRAAALGRDVVLVEEGRLGGVCLNRGCIPTKALLTTARALENARRARKLGLALSGDVSVDQPASVKRAKQVAGRMSKGVAHLMKAHGIRVVAGRGRLVAPGSVQVDSDATIDAGNVILATGARPRPLPDLPFDGERVISSTEALWLERVPRRLVIVGAGAIGMEFAYYYSVAGSEVTVVEALPTILPVADPEAVKAVEKAMRRRKVRMLAGTRVERVEVGREAVRIDLASDAGAESVEADRVLVSIGIVPNTEDLCGPGLGLEMDGPFVKVDAHMRTSIDGVYAIGDLAGPPLLAHAASHEGIVAAEHIAGRDARRKDASSIPGVVYSQPQVAQVGMSEQGARDAGLEIVVGRYPFLASGMAQAASEPDGFVKLVFDARTARLVGGVVVGAEAAELVSELCLALEAGLTHGQMLSAVHPHPTFSEAVMEAAAQAGGEPVHAV
jgi:dihydrolipoamide dehydrogenase